MNYREEIIIDGEEHWTLMDILPERSPIEILFVAKTPAPVSVEAGHYFKGRQGTMFWNKLGEYNILRVPYGEQPDNYLLRNNYGITDIVKKPRGYGNEPSEQEYKDGLNRILDLINMLQPKVIVFVYKAVLDNILRIGFGIKEKSIYGFNGGLDNHFGSKVFVFPMPGTPCTKQQAKESMTELMNILNK